MLRSNLMYRSYIERLTITETETPIPLPPKVPEEVLIKHEWAYPPFGIHVTSLCIPVIDIKTGNFNGQNIGKLYSNSRTSIEYI
jgi:hypothetical protein